MYYYFGFKGPHWKEALRILKLVVTRSSSLVAPPPNLSSYVTPSCGPPSMAWDAISTASSAFSSDTEQLSKKELPGRTLEFTFDVTQTPVIGRRHLKDETLNTRTNFNFNTLQQRSSSVGEIGSTIVGSIQSAWKRPWACQSRVRECLINVLNASGQRVGLPKSPSVRFQTLVYMNIRFCNKRSSLIVSNSLFYFSGDFQSIIRIIGKAKQCCFFIRRGIWWYK